MKVSDYMIRDVTTLDEQSHLLDAVLLIRRSGKRHIPVVDAEGRPVGLLTDRDIARVAPSMLTPMNAESYNQIFESTPVTKAMSRPPVTIRPDASVAEAVDMLHMHKCGALVVVNDAGVAMGIITTTDMLGLLRDLLQKTATTSA
jgi:predicted transcriptional regulator